MASPLSILSVAAGNGARPPRGAPPVGIDMRARLDARAALGSLDGAVEDVLGALGDILHDEMEAIMVRATELCPVDTGTLRDSAKVSPPMRQGAQAVAVEGSFGGNAREYAAYVHERLDVYHEPPTQAKFLETAAIEALDGMLERIADKARGMSTRNIGSGI